MKSIVRGRDESGSIMSIGFAIIDSGQIYLDTNTGQLHSLLIKWKKPPNKPYIAASQLMDAEREWRLRNLLMRNSREEVYGVIKEHLVRYSPGFDLKPFQHFNGYTFGGIVNASKGARVHVTFESEVAATLNALYMVSERVQRLTKAMTAAGIGTFVAECNSQGTGDGLNGITSRLFCSFESDHPAVAESLQITRQLLSIRSKRTHWWHLNANYEINEENSVVDVRFYFLSPAGDGSRTYDLRMSQLVQGQIAFENFLTWFVNRIGDEFGKTAG